MSGLSKWKLAVYLAAIFAAGGVSGWFAGQSAARSAARKAPPMEEFARSYREKLIGKLTLTEEQKARIDAILKSTSTEMAASHKQNLARINLARSNRTVQVAAILTADQRAQYEELEKAYEKERRERGTNSGKGRGDRPRGDGPPRERRERTNNSPVTNQFSDGQQP